MCYYTATMLRNVLSRIVHKRAIMAAGGSRFWFRLHRLCRATIGKHVWIAQMVHIDDLHPEDPHIGIRTSILTHFYWGPRRSRSNGSVVIESGVFVGPHCVILPNVRIGEGEVIKAGTVVSRNVPPRTFWGSPPAEALGVATVPLTAEHSYVEFARGMRPLSPKRSVHF